MTNIFLALLGLALLVLGWKLFWLFVGVMGFAAGLQAAQIYFGPQPFWLLREHTLLMVNLVHTSGFYFEAYLKYPAIRPPFKVTSRADAQST